MNLKAVNMNIRCLSLKRESADSPAIC